MAIEAVNSITLMVTRLILLTAWIAGIVLANGWISTISAIIFPFWSWYLVVEKLLQTIGWI